MSTNYHALAVQVVKVNSAEVGSEVQRRALDEQGVQGGQAWESNLEDAAGEVAEDARSATCVCGSLARDPLMLKCGHCGVEEHGACYAIVEETEAPVQHCCLRCSTGSTEGLVCTDPKLVKLSNKKPENVGNVCAFRRMLVILLKEEFENIVELVNRLGVEQEYGKLLFGKLCEDGVVSSGDDISFMTNQEDLQKAMGKRFGGKWKEGAKMKSQQENGEEGNNPAGAGNEGQQHQQGSSKVGSDKQGKRPATGGEVGSKRGKQVKMSTSGILDVSLGMEHNGVEEMSGSRKRKSATRGRKVSEVEAGGDSGKKKRRGRGK